MAVDAPNQDSYLVRFYRGEVVHPPTGDSIEEMLEWSDTRFFGLTNWVGWLFPSDRPDASTEWLTVSQLDLHLFRADGDLRAKVMKSFHRILSWLGLAVSSTSTAPTLVLTEEFESKRDRWLVPGNANLRKISRIIESLRLLHFDVAADLLIQLANLADVPRETRRYWYEAYQAGPRSVTNESDSPAVCFGRYLTDVHGKSLGGDPEIVSAWGEWMQISKYRFRDRLIQLRQHIGERICSITEYDKLPRVLQDFEFPVTRRLTLTGEGVSDHSEVLRANAAYALEFFVRDRQSTLDIDAHMRFDDVIVWTMTEQEENFIWCIRVAVAENGSHLWNR